MTADTGWSVITCPADVAAIAKALLPAQDWKPFAKTPTGWNPRTGALSNRGRHRCVRSSVLM